MAGADNIIGFTGKAGQAAKLDYDVPLPGRVVGRQRIILTDDALGIRPDMWLPAAGTAGIDVCEYISLDEPGDGPFKFDIGAALDLFRRLARANGVPIDPSGPIERGGLITSTDQSVLGTILPRTESLERDLPLTTTVYPAFQDYIRTQIAGSAAKKTQAARALDANAGIDPALTTPNIPTLDNETATLKAFLEKLATQRIFEVPRSPLPFSRSKDMLTVPYNCTANPEPALLLIEVYGISSFLGDYGLGRTVRTFTLFPGESVDISVKTWRSTTSTQQYGSSIVDSFQSEAIDRFAATLKNELSGRETWGETDKWNAEGHGGLDLGIISFGGGGGASQETTSSREWLAHSLGETVQEHSNQSNAARETTVTSASEQTTESGQETLEQRTIRNMNWRRVLNFVFRELNQEYITKVHLMDIRVAFSNGRIGSWREEPISGLRKLLSEVLKQDAVAGVAQQILKLIAVVNDYQDNPIHVLETITMQPDGSFLHEPAKPIDGKYAPPDENMFYRFNRGPLNPEKDAINNVDGVCMERRPITMRTDSVLVEALLGEADALDSYAMESQEAEAKAKTLANSRENLAQALLAEILDPIARAKAWADMFKVEIEDCDDPPAGPKV